MNKTSVNFLEKLKASGHWDDNYDYTKLNYSGNYNKVRVINKVLNSVHEVTPERLLKGIKLCAKNCIDKDDFIISEFRKIHKEKYDYSLVEYRITSYKL